MSSGIPSALRSSLKRRVEGNVRTGCWTEDEASGEKNRIQRLKIEQAPPNNGFRDEGEASAIQEQPRSGGM
jgi:hypothetical protein